LTEKVRKLHEIIFGAVLWLSQSAWILLLYQ